VRIERTKNMGDRDISSPQAAAVPAWRAGGFTVPFVGMKPSRMRRQRHWTRRIESASGKQDAGTGNSALLDSIIGGKADSASQTWNDGW
jgi:hypothetical protein